MRGSKRVTEIRRAYLKRFNVTLPELLKALEDSDDMSNEMYYALDRARINFSDSFEIDYLACAISDLMVGVEGTEPESPWCNLIGTAICHCFCTVSETAVDWVEQKYGDKAADEIYVYLEQHCERK